MVFENKVLRREKNWDCEVRGNRKMERKVKVKEIMCKRVGIGHNILNLSAIWR
jgi:hypothetical protein